MIWPRGTVVGEFRRIGLRVRSMQESSSDTPLTLHDYGVVGQNSDHQSGMDDFAISIAVNHHITCLRRRDHFIPVVFQNMRDVVSCKQEAPTRKHPAMAI